MSVRAIILAAGTGTRLRPITDDKPKCMVPLVGKTLLERQLGVFERVGISDVSIVLGHGAQSVEKGNMRVFLNEDHRTSNMVASLMRAKTLFDGGADILISYGDIVYERRVLETVLEGGHAISVAVDREWQRLWQLRMDDPLSDAETMQLAPNGRIRSLGKKPKSPSEIEGQYIGLFRIAASAVGEILAHYEKLDRSALYDGRDFDNMFMTSLLQSFIDTDIDVGAAFIDNGWLEIDTIDDLERYELLGKAGKLADYYDDRR